MFRPSVSSFWDYGLWRDYQGREKSHLLKSNFEDQKKHNWSDGRAGNKNDIWDSKDVIIKY